MIRRARSTAPASRRPLGTEDRKAGLTALHAAVVLFGMAGLFGKLIQADPLIIVLGRTLLAAAALGVLLPWQERGRMSGLKRDLPLLAAQGVILAFHWWAFFHAIRISSVAVGLLGFAAFPMFVTFLEPCFFEEEYRWFDIGTAAAVMAGLIAVAWPVELTSGRTWGAAWGALSGLLFAVLSLLNRKSVQSLPPIGIACFQNAFAFLALVPLSLWRPWHPTWVQIGLLLALGILCTALAHALFIFSLKAVTTQLASVAAALEPVYGIFFAFIVLGEKPGAATLAGGAVIVLATTLATLHRLRPGCRKEGAGAATAR